MAGLEIRLAMEQRALAMREGAPVGALETVSRQREDCMDDVIVVGAGPTGLITALGLAQLGVRVRVLEAEPHIINSPRAAVYHWSVLDGIAKLGILDEAGNAGFRKQDYTYHVLKTGERIPYSLEILEGRTPHPYNLHLGQHQLAEIALRRLRALPTAVASFNMRVVQIEQEQTAVTVLADGDSGRQEFRAKWVIGADGAGSTVRRLSGLPFEGTTWPERFVATNVFFDFEKHGFARTTQLIDDQHGAIIAKLASDGLWRLTYMEDAELPEDTFLTRLPDAYAAIIPNMGGYRLERATPYRMHQRTAPRYRSGRLILVGDAAHVTNPTGGLGLTSGLFDSFSLYPALAAVVQDHRDDEILNRYSEIRRQIFLERVSPQACANKQLIYHANGGGADLEQALQGIRRLANDAQYRLQRLMYTKTLESPLL
jgi:3-(3-hydroxy-phenyl)propionate hydroxylase